MKQTVPVPKEKRTIVGWLNRAYNRVLTLLLAVTLTTGTSFAATDTIWTRMSTIVKDVYGQVVGISTIVGVTVAAIALVIRMVSRNQRAVDEATTWLKRIVVTWLILNTLGFAVAYLQPLISGGSYTGP